MVDFLRLYHTSLLGTLFFLVVIIVLAAVLIPRLPDENRRAGRRATFVLCLAVLFVGALALLASMSVNQTPRGVLDRSDVEKQQERFEERHQDVSTESKEETR